MFTATVYVSYSHISELMACFDIAFVFVDAIEILFSIVKKNKCSQQSL